MIILSAKIKTTSSYRSLSKIFIEINLYLNLGHSSPSFTTIKLWVKKVGYYQLHLPKEQADDWVIILDESIGIGQEKVLAIMGIRQSKIDFKRPLQLQDLQPLLVKSKESWTGEMISKELEEIKLSLGCVKYAVTDAGCSLKKGLNLSNITHIYDITHSTANMLEKLYSKDKLYVEYSKQATQMRFKLCCSKYAHLIPPNQRSKSRFLNVDVIVKWGADVLKALNKNNLPKDILEQLEWVKEYAPLIKEMNELLRVIAKISIMLKSNGLSRTTISKSKNLLKNCREGKKKELADYFANYFEVNGRYLAKRGDKYLCCSDIIETTFGRYKNELSKNLMCGITDLVLFIPAMTTNLSPEIVLSAIDSIRVKDIEAWKSEYLCNSLISKRRKVFAKKVG